MDGTKNVGVLQPFCVVLIALTSLVAMAKGGSEPSLCPSFDPPRTYTYSAIITNQPATVQITSVQMMIEQNRWKAF